MPMNWNINQQITDIALHIHVDLADADTEQYPGRAINTNLWKNFTISRNFPPELVVCSPANIIECFQDDLFLEGLILTINWGKMNKTVEKIFNQDVRTIDECLKKCKEDISQHHSINNSWDWLTIELGWTNVMTSKVLHFLCRSLNLTKVPVPIDNAQILDKFRPMLKKFLEDNQERFRNYIPLFSNLLINNLLRWGQNQNRSFESYQRYMQFIIAWSDDGDTTAFEVKLFNKLKVNGQVPIEFLE